MSENLSCVNNECIYACMHACAMRCTQPPAWIVERRRNGLTRYAAPTSDPQDWRRSREMRIRSRLREQHSSRVGTVVGIVARAADEITVAREPLRQTAGELSHKSGMDIERDWQRPVPEQ